MFQTIYQSSWQHPGLAWIAGVPLLSVGLWAALQGRRARDPDPRRSAWLIAFFVLEAEILLDAWLTGGLAPFPSDGIAATVAAVVFVILGDLRFFYLVERQRGLAAAGAKAALRALAIALPISLVVPVATAVLHRVDARRWSGNLLYLVYEAGLLALVILYCGLRMPKTRDGADGRARYVARLLAFEVAQYGLWIVADAVIVSGGWGMPARVAAAAWLLRIVPNALYYAVFVPMATWATPSGSRV